MKQKVRKINENTRSLAMLNSLKGFLTSKDNSITSAILALNIAF